MQRSLRSKLFFQYTALVLICMLVIPAFISWQMNRQFHRFSAERFAEDKQQLVSVIEKSFAEGITDGSNLHGEMLRWPLVKFSVSDVSGKKLFEIRHVSRHKQSAQMQRRLEEKIQLQTEDFNYPDGKKAGTVTFYVVPFSFSREGFFLKSFQRNMEVWVAIMLIFAAAFAFFMTGKIIRPLLTTAQRAEQISKGDYLAAKSESSDITEIQTMLDSVDKLGSELAEQEALRKRLMTDIAHELRNPITVVKAHLEAFADGVWEPTEERVNLTLAEVDRLSLLIKEVEQLTTVEKAGSELAVSGTNLSQLTEKCAQTFIPMFDSKGVSLEQNIEENINAVVDPAKIRQVIENLISNALRYTDKGGRVTVSLKNDEDKILLSVCDNGIGIAEQDLPNIFERFYRTDKSRARESGGMGIGLAIVKAIVEAHGASIKAESTEGEGSCFTVTFPSGTYKEV